MAEAIQSPAQATFWFVQGRVLFWLINLLGSACFAYIVAKRLTPLMRGQRDMRFDRPLMRLGRLLKFWFGQWRHPRYLAAGIIHILLFSGFIVLVMHTFALLAMGTSGRHAAAAAAGGECLAPKAFLDMLDGRTTWRGREELEHHVTRCWHCVDHFCRLAEVVELLRGIQPLSDLEAEPFRKLLGVPPAKRPGWKRWLAGGA